MLTGLRTIIVAILLAVLQVIAVTSPGTILPDPEQVSTAVEVLLALLAPGAMIVMRLLTKTPVGGEK